MAKPEEVGEEMKELTDTQKQILASKLERKQKKKEKRQKKKEERQKHKGSKIAFGIVFLILIAIGISITFVSVDKEKPTGTKTQVETGKITTEQKKPQLVLSSDDILSSKGMYKGKEIISTQCYAENKTDQDWEGSVKMTVYDTKGNVVYASFDTAWIGVSVKAGERDYYLAAIPIEKVVPYRYAGIVIRWEWGRQKAEQKFSF